MTYIKEYQEGNKFFGIYLCKSKQVLKTKAGKTYYYCAYASSGYSIARGGDC